MRRRVVVTGMGIVSSLGDDVSVYYDNLLAGKSGISKIEKFSVDGYVTQIAGEIKDFDPGDYIDKKSARRIDDYIGYILVAGKKALQFGDLDCQTVVADRCGIVIGSGMGGMNIFSEGITMLNEKGVRRLTPFFVPFILTNMGGGMLAIDTGFMGPNYSISTACATANNCIIAAAQHIVNDRADCMLCGGGEAALCPIGLGGFIACKALSQRNDNPEGASRPWDKNRDGFVMSEGAGVLLLEGLDHALARGATILAEYVGGAMSCDAYHITDPRNDGMGAKQCMEKALQDAGVTSDDVNYINAHATSTLVGDLAEIRAVHALFGPRNDLFINATKSMTGHALGAAGGMEAIATVKAIATGVIHPTRNCDDPEPVLGGLRFSTEVQEVDVTVAMSNSFGFGGHNATVLFAPYRE